MMKILIQAHWTLKMRSCMRRTDQQIIMHKLKYQGNSQMMDFSIRKKETIKTRI